MIVQAAQANGFRISLPFQDRRLQFGVDTVENDARTADILLEDGVEDDSARTEYEERIRINDSPGRLVIRVSGKKVALSIDGETIVEHEGPVSDYRYDWAPQVEGEEQRGSAVLTFYGSYTVHRMRLLPADAGIEPIDLSRFSPPTPPAPTEPAAEKPESKPTPAPPPSPEPAMAEPAADDPVTERLAEIDRKYRQVFEAPYEEALGQLNQQFTGALQREEKAASGTGDLDLVLAFQEESKRIGNGEGAGPADEADAPPRLAQLRATWHAQHSKLLEQKAANQARAHAARDQALDLYQQELVKAQDVASAQRIKALREQFDADPQGAAVAATTPPPPPVRATTPMSPSRGRLNSTRPVITSPPERFYPPKRPERSGELITFPVSDDGGEIRVVSRDIIDFRASGTSAFALTTEGRIEKHGNQGAPIYQEFAKVKDRLTDIVSFDITGNGIWAVALDAAGKAVLWGKNSADGALLRGPEEGNQLVRVLCPSFAYGVGLTRSGELVQWPSNLNHFRDARSNADFERATNAQILLTDRGKLEVHGGQWPQHFTEEERERLEGIRNAVRIASTPGDARMEAAPTLVLLDTGEVVPAGWPRDRYPDGNPLPPDLPRDIEQIQVAILSLAGNTREAVGGILSRSRGWTFVGEPKHTEAIATKARGCFQFDISGQDFWGLRDPALAVATPPSPNPDRNPNDPAAVANGEKLPDLPPARRMIAENGGSLHVWGTFAGKPIDDRLEREIGRGLRQRDYTRVGLGGYNEVGLLAIRANGNGDRVVLHGDAEDNEPAIQAFEHQEILALLRNPLGFISEGKLFEGARGEGWTTDGGLGIEVNEETIMARGANPFLLFGSASHGFQFAGFRVPNNLPFFEAIAEEIDRDRPTLIGGEGLEVDWVTADAKVRIKRIRDTEGEVEDMPVPVQPPERIVEWAFYGPGVFGVWIARGESGNIYMEGRDGFAAPVPELSPARALRAAGVPAQAVALQKPDGSWHSIGLDPELNEFVSKIGPAIDLDIFLRSVQGKLVHRVVAWVEPESSL